MEQDNEIKPLWNYRAINGDGEVVHDAIHADDMGEAYNLLREENLFPGSIRLAPGENLQWAWERSLGIDEQQKANVVNMDEFPEIQAIPKPKSPTKL